MLPIEIHKIHKIQLNQETSAGFLPILSQLKSVIRSLRLEQVDSKTNKPRSDTNKNMEEETEEPLKVARLISLFQVTTVAARINQSLKYIIVIIQDLFGEAFHTWVQDNYAIFPNIQQDIDKMIYKFQATRGAVFPQSMDSIREQLASIMAYTQESLFNPNMNIFRHAFPENEHWGHSPMMNEAFKALTTMRCDWHKFKGPCDHILHQWSNMTTIYDDHLNRIPRSLAAFTKQDWITLPNIIKHFVVCEFPVVARALELSMDWYLEYL